MLLDGLARGHGAPEPRIAVADFSLRTVEPGADLPHASHNDNRLDSPPRPDRRLMDDFCLPVPWRAV
jgi:hypothetical protein